MVILSATMPDAARELQSMQQKLNKLRSTPIFGYGGGAFLSTPALRQKIPGLYLGDTLDQALMTITQLFDRKRRR